MIPLTTAYEKEKGFAASLQSPFSCPNRRRDAFGQLHDIMTKIKIFL